jgi:hypothetical protein
MTSLPRALWRSLPLLGVAWSAGAPPLRACDPAWLPITRSAAFTYFVLLARADTVLELPERLDAVAPQSGFARRLTWVSGRARGGQRVQLQEIRGAGDARGTRPTEAVVVPWAYGPDCRPIAWTESLVWIASGTQGFMTGWLRPRERWLGGVPTFDVEMAWREPLWKREDPRWPRGGAADALLSPEEFLDLYEALPELEQLERYPREAAAPLRRWERDHPDLAGRPPARTILENVYRTVAERTKRSGR